MPIDFEPLVRALEKFRANGGSFADLERATKAVGKKVSAATIGRTVSRRTVPAPETWEALYSARPQEFPAPPWEAPSAPESFSLAITPNEFATIPVFNAGAGPNKFWTDGGFEPGDADHFLSVPAPIVDRQSFGVICHGGSMGDVCSDGDIAIVNPSEPPQHGKLCFATWPEEDGARLVRRYYKYGNTIVLKPDNPAEGQEVELNANNGHGVRIFRVVAVHKRNP